MSLEWINDTQDTLSVYRSQCTQSDMPSIRQALGESIEKAISLLHTTIQDDSLYFLIEWNQENQQLSIRVCDDKKSQFSPQQVSCGLPVGQEDSAQLSEWARDYLTTSNSFIRFSLVAIFRLAGDEKVVLL